MSGDVTWSFGQVTSSHPSATSFVARRCSSSWTIRASLAFWAARTLALGCFFKATFALSLGGTIRSCRVPFGLHARSFAWTRNTVTNLFGLALAPFMYRRRFEAHSRMGLLILRCSVSLARSLLSVRLASKPMLTLASKHFASHNPRPFRRSRTFVLRAEHDDRLLGSRAAPYCGSPQPFQLPGVGSIETM